MCPTDQHSLSLVPQCFAPHPERIITSGESPAIDNISTYQSLCDRHPHTPSDRIPLRPEQVISSSVHWRRYNCCYPFFPSRIHWWPKRCSPSTFKWLHFQKRNRPRPHRCLNHIHQFTNARQMPIFCDSIFFGGGLIVLQKKSGGIRPIAVGYTLRRLASNCAPTNMLLQPGKTVLPISSSVLVYPVVVRQPPTPPAVFLPTCLTTSSLLRLISQL